MFMLPGFLYLIVMKNLLLFLVLLMQFAVAAQGKTRFRTIECPSVPDTTRTAENTIHAAVDTRASFPGGLTAFQAFFDKNFNREGISAGREKERIFVSFIIEKDGALSTLR